MKIKITFLLIFFSTYCFTQITTTPSPFEVDQSVTITIDENSPYTNLSIMRARYHNVTTIYDIDERQYKLYKSYKLYGRYIIYLVFGKPKRSYKNE